LQLCEQIQLKENKQKKTDDQRNVRFLKRRKIEKSNTINEG
jgi:hypothetical protein